VFCALVTQGSSFLATLGFVAESRWDSIKEKAHFQNGFAHKRATTCLSFITQETSILPPKESSKEPIIMKTQNTFLRRDPVEIQPWTETCGQIRCLIEEKDGAAGEVHQVEIRDAKLHYHERTDEFYYVIEGQGTMLLDDTEIELHRGVVVYVPRGVKHKATGTLSVLVVCVPAGVLNDVHELE
jgi:mannose-6-phosphate isomerase-like protein (cupin superfamily)